MNLKSRSLVALHAISAKWLCSILPVLLIAHAAVEQSTREDSSSKTPVILSFFALNPKGEPISEVRRDDLTVLDNKQRALSIVSVEKGLTLPLRLGLVIDDSNSESVSHLFGPAVRAASTLLPQLLSGPNDKVAIIKVSNKPEATSLMSRDEFLKHKIEVILGGGTALYDGVSLASDQLTKMDATRRTRRVLILLTDGDDNLSRRTRDEALVDALKSGVIIFAVSTADDSVPALLSYSERGNNALKVLSEKTGGRAFLHLDRTQIDKTFAEIQRQIAGMYAITFTQADEVEKGFHPIKLNWSSANKVEMRAPLGYYSD